MRHYTSKGRCDVTELLETAQRIQLPPNSMVIKGGGEVLPCVFYLESGIAALSDDLDSGDNRVYRYHRPGEFLGIFQLYNQTPDFKDTVTKTDCVLYRVDGQTFLDYAYAHPDLLIDQIRMVGEINLHQFARYTDMLRKRTANIICEVLLDFSCEKDGVRRLNRYFTNAEIARYLGVHPVTVSKVMLRLQQEGVVIRQDGHIVLLDTSRLKAYKNGEKLQY